MERQTNVKWVLAVICLCTIAVVAYWRFATTTYVTLGMTWGYNKQEVVMSLLRANGIEFGVKGSRGVASFSVSRWDAPRARALVEKHLGKGTLR